MPVRRSEHRESDGGATVVRDIAGDVSVADVPGGSLAQVAARSGRRRVSAWLWGALAALLVVAGGTTVLLRPGGEVRADVTEHFDLAAAEAAIAPGNPRHVLVRAQADDLSEVGAVLATYAGTIRCGLTATLRDGGTVVASSTTDCASIPDNETTILMRFAPVAHSAGRVYDLTLEVTPGSVIGPSLWRSTQGVESVITYYDPPGTVAQRVSTVLQRISDYAPAWGSPAGLIAVVLLAAGSVVALIARPRWGLAALLVLVVLRGLMWSVLIPPLQGMDEGAHFANVQFIAEEGRLPNWNTTDHRYGAYSASLGVASDAMHVSAHRPTDRPDYGTAAVTELHSRDLQAGTGSDGTSPAASYPPAYYAPAALFYLAAPDDTVSQVAAVRLWSALLGAAAVVFAWLFAGEVLPGRRTARAGLVVAIALQPMVAHQFAIVNNDGWVITCGFAALWTAARLVRTARAPWWMLLAGGVVGLGALGKPFAAIAAFPVAAGWLLGKVRFRERSARVLLLEPLLAGVGVAVTYGTWLVASRLLGINTGLGFPQLSSPGPRDVLTYIRTQIDPGFLEFRGLWVTQFWGNFGWVDTPLPQLAYDVIWWGYVALAAAVVGWIVVVVRGGRGRDERRRDLDRLITLCLVTLLTGLMGMYAIEYLYFASSGRTDLLQGRYLLMLVPALLALPVLLARRLVPRRWAGSAAAWSVAGGVAVLHVLAIGVVVMHYYL